MADTFLIEDTGPTVYEQFKTGLAVPSSQCGAWVTSSAGPLNVKDGIACQVTSCINKLYMSTKSVFSTVFLSGRLSQFIKLSLSLKELMI